MSLFDRKHGRETGKGGNYGNYNSNNSSYGGKGYGYGGRNYQGWDEPVKMTYSEHAFLDCRDLAYREDEDGSRLKFSDDKTCEVLPLAVSKPASQGSLAQAVRDKRATVVFMKLGSDWIASTRRAHFFERVFTTEMSDQHCLEIAKILGDAYRERGIKMQSVRDWIDEQENIKTHERMKKQNPKTKAKFVDMPVNDPVSDDDDDDFMDAFKNAYAPEVSQTPNPRDRKRGRLNVRRGSSVSVSTSASAHVGSSSPSSASMTGGFEAMNIDGGLPVAGPPPELAQHSPLNSPPLISPTQEFPNAQSENL